MHGSDTGAAHRVREDAAQFFEPVGVELAGQRNGAAVTDLADRVVPAGVDELTSSIWRVQRVARVVMAGAISAR